ncbi:MAG: radical SAM protein [Caldimicrobium sp.]
MKVNYLKYEKNFIRKRWKGRLPIALIFPNKYEIGMSNLGFLYLYERLNSYEEIVCERFFYEEGKIRSIENNRPLRDFPMLFFSIPFEGDYVNVLKILLKEGLELNPSKRKELVLGGGIATWSNPFPLLPFIDGFLLGEWEAIEEIIIPLLLEYALNKEVFLDKFSHLSFFLSSQVKDLNKSVKVIKKRELTEPIFSKVISERAQFKESYLLEVSRGCGRACRFCLAGFIYRPPRDYKKEDLLRTIEEIPSGSKVGLVGLEFVNKEQVVEIGEALLKKGISLTFSSLRLDALNEAFLSLLKTTRSVALAPETASNKLKRVINKVIPNELIVDTLERFKDTSIKKIKFYFMFGLPFEEEADLEETIAFIKSLCKRKYPFKLAFNFSPFIPKPQTPFQWADFDLEALKVKREKLRKELLKFTEIKIASIKEAYLQALLARGDKNLEDFLLALASGVPLPKAQQYIDDLEFILKPPKMKTIKFPWDKIDIGVSKDFLYFEWIKATKEKPTIFCQPMKCRTCGACKILNV